MKTIVVAYDGTEPAKRALDRTAELAAAFSSTVIVTSVAPVLLAGPRGAGAIDPTDSPETHDAELQEGVALLAERGVSAEAQPGVGDPAPTIIEIAEARGADLIVVGTREPSAVERILQGSVSAAVSRQAHCDVLIVH
jgi:nucleotide-binding universal stress UspA family protein